MKRHQDRHAARRRLARSQRDQHRGVTRRSRPDLRRAVAAGCAREITRIWVDEWPALEAAVGADRLDAIAGALHAGLRQRAADSGLSLAPDPEHPGIYFLSVDPAAGQDVALLGR